MTYEKLVKELRGYYMEFQKFVKLLICKIQLYIGNEYEISEHKVTKNNSVELTGIMAKKKGSNVFPTYYVDDFYDEYMKEEDLEMLALKLARHLESAAINETMCIDEFVDFETARNSIYLKLINADQNKNLLLDIPHVRFHNLAIVFIFMLGTDVEGAAGTILIRNEHMENWDKATEEIYTIAYENTHEKFPAKVYGIFDIMENMSGKRLDSIPDIERDAIPMKVVTNESKMYGASVMLYPDEMEEIGKQMGGSFYILPSSIHELILLPDDGDINPAVYLNMVTEVNATELNPQEVLADSIYYFNSDTQSVEWIC